MSEQKSFPKAARGMLVGATLAAAGVFVTAALTTETSGETRSQVGGALLLAGWCVAGWSLHKFGRAQISE